MQKAVASVELMDWTNLILVDLKVKTGCYEKQVERSKAN